MYNDILATYEVNKALKKKSKFCLFVYILIETKQTKWPRPWKYFFFVNFLLTL